MKRNLPQSQLDDAALANCVEDAFQLIRQLPHLYLIANGKVEKQLKVFLGCSWEGMGQQHAYAFDKKVSYPNGAKRKPREIDFIAFDGGAPRFWFEAKCSFLSDPSNTKGTIRKAAMQAKELVAANFPDLQCSQGYIVHFLNKPVAGSDGRLPVWIHEKLPTQHEWTPAVVEKRYREELSGAFEGSMIKSDENLKLAVVVIRLAR